MLKEVYVAELETGHILKGYTDFEKGICKIDKKIKGVVVKFPIDEGDIPAKLSTYIVSEDKIFDTKEKAMDYIKRYGG